MPLWFFIALLAPILWAFVNVADKYLVSHYRKDNQSSGSLALFSCLVALIACGLIAVFVHGIDSVSFVDRLILMSIGVFDFVWILFYLFSFEIEDASTVVPWMQLIPVFGYLFGYIFFKEVLTLHQIVGSLIILLGALIISIDFREVKFLFKKKVALYMTIACIFYAINGVLFKFVASTDSFLISSFWQYLGLALAGVVMFSLNKTWRQQFLTTGLNGGKFILFLNLITEFMTVSGNFLTNYAVLLAPVAMVYLVSSFQPIFVLVIAFLCTKFLPKVVKEDFSLKVLAPKLIAIVVMILGSFFLFVV